MFHARFSNIVENPELIVEQPKEEVKEIVQEETKEEIDTQSTERRLEIKHNAKMENENKPSESEAESKAPEVNPLEAKVQELEAKLAEMSKPKEVPKEQPKEEPKATIVESTQVNPTPNVISMDENALANMVEKIAEKMKPVAPITVNEFGSMPQDPEEATIDRLAESLAK
jgi:polyhydroxyalkanoate synthesis regulator phasin